MIAPGSVSAVIATRGDVPMMEPVSALRSGGISDVVVWDNSTDIDGDLGPYARFVALDRALNDVILVQDDDVVLPPETVAGLCAAYEPGKLVTNMPEIFRQHYSDSVILGFGAIFDADLPERAFSRFFGHWPLMTRHDPLFIRESCRAFAILTPTVLVDLPKEDLPWANAPNRLWRQPDHVAMRERMLDLARQVRDA